MRALKCLLIVCTIFLFAAETKAQQYPKLVVVFKNKNNSPYSLSNPSQYLSQRAIDRRTRYSIALDSTDLPVNPSYIQQVLAQGPVTYLSQSKWLNQALVYCTDNATISAIAALPFVSSVAAIGNFAGSTSTQDRFKETVKPLALTEKTTGATELYNYGNSYGQIHIHNGEFLHSKGFTGKGLVIAILDAGFYKYRTIIAFDSTRAHKRFLGERDFVAFDGSVNEDDSHGEYCLSTIAANVPGVMVGTAPDAAFWLLRTENTASEMPVEEHNWVAGAEFADSAGADLISSSLGYYSFDNPALDHTYSNFYNNTTMVSKGATYAARKGMIVTNSAGNEGATSWKYLIFPADADSVCAVAATDVNKNIAYFSSYGYPGKIKPNIASVGLGTTVYTSFGVSSGSGTSFSNPNINGLIACLWQAFPQFNNMTILAAIDTSSSKAGNAVDRVGYGIPNMKKAFRYLKSLQNVQQYGKDWLFVNAAANGQSVNVKLIGRTDGASKLNLVDKSGKIISSIVLSTEMEEVYDTAFSFSMPLPAGTYAVQYADAVTVRSIDALKVEGQQNKWLRAAPVPFDSYTTLYLTAPETGKISLRLIDGKGKQIQLKELNVVQNNQYQVAFTKTASLSKGVYYIEYNGALQHSSIQVVR